MWQYLTEQAHEDKTLDASLTVKDIMDTWTLQKGYPVINVMRDYNAKTMKLTQKWFLLNPTNKIQNTPEYAKYKWFVPFTFTSKETQDFDFESRPQWIKPNDTEGKIFKKK